jgi:hypothetical protein
LASAACNSSSTALTLVEPSASAAVGSLAAGAFEAAIGEVLAEHEVARFDHVHLLCAGRKRRKPGDEQSSNTQHAEPRCFKRLLLTCPLP